jgi:acyl-CoA hydrolase
MSFSDEGRLVIGTLFGGEALKLVDKVPPLWKDTT